MVLFYVMFREEERLAVYSQAYQTARLDCLRQLRYSYTC